MPFIFQEHWKVSLTFWLQKTFLFSSANKVLSWDPSAVRARPDLFLRDRSLCAVLNWRKLYLLLFAVAWDGMFLIIQGHAVFPALAVLNSAQIHLKKRVCDLKRENAWIQQWPPVLTWKIRIINTRRRFAEYFCPFLGCQSQMRNSGHC